MDKYNFDKNKYGFKESAFETYSLTREQRENRRLRNLTKKNKAKNKITSFDQYSLGDMLCVYRLMKDKFPKMSPIVFMMLFTLYELEHFTLLTVQSLLHTSKNSANVTVHNLKKHGIMEVRRGNADTSNGYLALYALTYKARYLINQCYKMLYGKMDIPDHHLPLRLKTPPVKK